MTTVPKGTRLTYRKNGKTYVAQFDSKLRAGFYGSQWVWAQPLNPKTGQPWQAGIYRDVRDFEVQPQGQPL